MTRRIFILFIVLFASEASQYSFAEQTTIREQSEPIFVSDSEPTFVAPTSVRDTLVGADSIIVIHTVCAPICSSHVRIYDKEWKEIGILKAPFQSPFPEAYILDGKILWRDNDNFDYTPCL